MIVVVYSVGQSHVIPKVLSTLLWLGMIKNFALRSFSASLWDVGTNDVAGGMTATHSQTLLPSAPCFWRSLIQESELMLPWNRERERRFMVVYKPERDTMTNKLISPSKAGRQMERKRVSVSPAALHLRHGEQLACRGQQSLTAERLSVHLLPSDTRPVSWGGTEHPAPRGGHRSGGNRPQGFLLSKMCEVQVRENFVPGSQGEGGGGGRAEEHFVPYIPRGSCSAGFRERGSSPPHLHLCEIDGT